MPLNGQGHDRHAGGVGGASALGFVIDGSVEGAILFLVRQENGFVLGQVFLPGLIHMAARVVQSLV